MTGPGIEEEGYCGEPSPTTWPDRESIGPSTVGLAARELRGRLGMNLRTAEGKDQDRDTVLRCCARAEAYTMALLTLRGLYPDEPELVDISPL